MNRQRGVAAWCCAVLLLGWLLPLCAAAASLTILTYHRFGAQASDSMTLRTATFAAQLGWLRQHGYRIVPLQQALQERAAQVLADRSVAITVDDGHRSVYDELLPLVLRENVPVTLFIYPSAISNAVYAMSWQQLAELQRTGLFAIESHTYWHPNFRQEKRRLSPLAYRRLLQMQLEMPRQVLRNKLGVAADLLAWPFGIYDDELMQAAHEAGYRAAFSIDGRPVRTSDGAYSLPRFLIVESLGMQGFINLFKEAEK